MTGLKNAQVALLHLPYEHTITFHSMTATNNTIASKLAEVILLASLCIMGMICYHIHREMCYGGVKQNSPVQTLYSFPKRLYISSPCYLQLCTMRYWIFNSNWHLTKQWEYSHTHSTQVRESIKWNVLRTTSLSCACSKCQLDATTEL